VLISFDLEDSSQAFSIRSIPKILTTIPKVTFMKASRRLYDNYDVNGEYDDLPDRFADPTHDSRCPSARRSLTLNNFYAPGLLQRPSSDVTEEEETWNEEEEEWDDSAHIEQCFSELGRRFVWDHENDEEIANGLRNLDYSVSHFIAADKAGHFGDPMLTKKGRKARPKPAPPQEAEKPAPPPPVTRSYSMAAVVARQHVDCRRTVASVQKELRSVKRHLSLVIVGHVDAGKSTLMGHFLVLLGRVSHGQMTKLSQETRQKGKEEDKFAWVMAEDEAEREHGVTIDVAMNEFETPELNVTVLDAPGHKDFVGNMIAGASQADAALLVVDVTNPLIDRGQAREHVHVCRALGVSTLVVAVNKMDAVSYDPAVYEDVKNRMANFLKTVGWSAASFVPTAANQGEGLVRKSSRMPWYDGPCILEAINAIAPSAVDVASPFLLCVSDSTESTGKEVTVTGRIESGFLCKTDTVKIVPGDKTGRVTAIRLNGKPVSSFVPAGRIVEITIASTADVRVGSAIIAPERNLAAATQFKARIATFTMQVPLLKGAALLFHRHAVDTPLSLVQILNWVNRKTGEVVKKGGDYITSNSRADVVFRLTRTALPLEVQNISKSFSRFIIRAKGETLGFGSITEVMGD
jgi:elongation factor 1 alpha-like protein